MRTLCIIPALNEAGRIERVLEVVIACTDLDAIYVADNGSTDATRSCAECFGVQVISCPVRGKGNAITHVMNLYAEPDDVVLLLDADLIGLNLAHLESLIEPVRSGRFVQAAGVRDTWLKRLHWRWHVGLTGERAFRASLLWEICEVDYQGWALETALNSICRWSPLRKKRQIAKIFLTGVHTVDKVDKYPSRSLAYRAKSLLFVEWLLGALRFNLPVEYKHWLS